MTVTLNCSELFAGCPAEVRADTAEEVLQQAAEHAADAHGLTELDDSTAAAVRAAIRIG